jgi:hypothetical protein
MALKVEFRDWLAAQVESVQGQLESENSPERLQMLREAPAPELPDVRAGWLMGYADALQGILNELPPGLLTRKIDMPDA